MAPSHLLPSSCRGPGVARRPLFPPRAAASAGGAGAPRPRAKQQQQQPDPSPPHPPPQPLVLFEGASELNGLLQIHEVPYAEGIPPEIQGSRLLYAGAPARLAGVFRPIGDDYPLTYAHW